MMKSKLLAAVAVAVTAVAALSASATASAAGNVTVVNVAGDDAYTTFISESDCVETTVGIVAAHESTQQPPGNTVLVTPVFIRLAQFNTCTGTPLRELTGFHRLEKSSFQVSGPAPHSQLDDDQLQPARPPASS
jgi:hypothetical protein